MSENLLLVLVSGGIGILGTILGIFLGYLIENHKDKERDRKNLYDRRLKNAEECIYTMKYYADRIFEDCIRRQWDKESIEEKTKYDSEFAKMVITNSLRSFMDSKSSQVAMEFHDNCMSLSICVDEYLINKSDEKMNNLVDTYNKIMDNMNNLLNYIDEFTLNGYKNKEKFQLFKKSPSR